MPDSNILGNHYISELNIRAYVLEHHKTDSKSFSNFLFHFDFKRNMMYKRQNILS